MLEAPALDAVVVRGSDVSVLAAVVAGVWRGLRADGVFQLRQAQAARSSWHYARSCEPPRLTAQRLAGTWSDGNGGRIIFTADGKVTADGVRTFGFDDDRHDAGRPRTGAGTWVHHPGDGSWSQNVEVSVDACEGGRGPWEVFGTPGHPKLYVLVGDPDAWDLYVLEPDDQPREEPVRD